MRRRLLWISGIKVLLLTIFIGYVGVFTFHTHLHIVDGVTIVHAHPFKKAPGDQPFHQHSRAELQLINSLSSLNVGDDIVPHFTFDNTCFNIHVYTVPSVCSGYAVLLTDGLSLRAPPVV